ncbi:MAG: universal stress protein [Gemmatimonadaceae bacterium]
MSSPVFASAEFAGSAGAELVDPLRRHSTATDQVFRGAILVATDAGRASAAALRVASALSARDGLRVEAILVEEDLPALPDVCLGARALRLECLPESTRLGRVRRQLCTILEGSSWKLRVGFGRMGPTIARAARTSRASLILMGLSREGLARRLLGTGAVGRILQLAQKPVLAVPSTGRVLPHAAVAAIDFSPASVRAAREARDLLARPGTLHLVHVRPAAAENAEGIASWDAIDDADATIKLRELACELSTDGVTVLPRMESGALIESLSRVMSETGAELIACGARNQTSIERHLLGYVPLQLVLNAECSILIAPAVSCGAFEELR